MQQLAFVGGGVAFISLDRAIAYVQARIDGGEKQGSALAIFSGVSLDLFSDGVMIGRFRRPTPAQAAMLRSLSATALRMSETATGEVDLYVQHARKPNAYAAGRRSVAVTSRVLEDC